MSVLPTDTRLLPADYRRAFLKAGIKAGTKDWKKYEHGKTVLWNMNLTPDEYEMGIKTLLGWLKL